MEKNIINLETAKKLKELDYTGRYDAVYVWWEPDKSYTLLGAESLTDTLWSEEYPYYPAPDYWDVFDWMEKCCERVVWVQPEANGMWVGCMTDSRTGGKMCTSGETRYEVANRITELAIGNIIYGKTRNL